MEADVFARLVDAHAAGLHLYARQWSPAPEDVVQEAFIKLLGQRRPPLNAAAWLYRVVRNAAISAQRAAQRRKRHEDAARTANVWFEPADAAFDGHIVAGMLEQLPGEQREAITLHLWGGRSFAEIAEIIGCSSSSAHRLYAAGLAALRERLRVQCPNP